MKPLNYDTFLSYLHFDTSKNENKLRTIDTIDTMELLLYYIHLKALYVAYAKQEVFNCTRF